MLKALASYFLSHGQGTGSYVEIITVETCENLGSNCTAIRVLFITVVTRALEYVLRLLHVVLLFLRCVCRPDSNEHKPLGW